MGDEVQLTGAIAMTVSPEPWLVEIIKNYRNALQFVVDSILQSPTKYGYWRYVRKERRIKWIHDIKKLHENFYDLLKHEFKLPPKIAQDCFREGAYIAKSVLNNENNTKRKAVIKKVFLRLNNQAYKLIWDNDYLDSIRITGLGTVRVTEFPRRLFERYKDWKLGDAIVKLSKGKVKFYVTLKKMITLPEPSDKAVAIDLNFEEIVVGNLAREMRIRTPMRRIMHIKRNHIEKIQKRYNRSWRHVKGIRKAITRWWNKINGLLGDFVKQTAKNIVKWAKSLGYDTIIMEDLNGLKDKQAKMKKSWRDRFTFFIYRQIQKWIEWQALKHGLAVVYLPPNNTSKLCPLCGSKVRKYNERTVKCNCGITMDRDVLAVWNLSLKWLSILRCGALRLAPNGVD